MAWQTDSAITVTAGGKQLEARCYGPPPGERPTVVMLHEGLGSVGLWRDFPRKLADETGWGVFCFSRAGYGNSEPVDLPRPLDYMTREAVDVLPDVLHAIGFKEGILLGHSDGATIAAIYGGSVQDHRVRGLVLIAPHFFTEPEGLASIAEARNAYGAGLREKLARHHADVDVAFKGWNDAWLDPGFKEWNVEEVIDYLRIPVLAMQGRNDQYGTLKQIEAIESRIYSPADVEIIEDSRHAPFLDQPEKTLAAVAEFVARLDRIEHTQVEMA
ncbi:alpha/beta fold hydrolase [Pararhizobium haloflavum]|uniref:alpha/beta fold hydrolase n=1 Tax=Pararhizobium haloflavum TaxID=2037914 RepID=UPI000C197DCE|nr:alpha/beta hydrolase [Pararhizobium haloflavum]